MMSIPLSERRKLRAIEQAIAAAEPVLADRYAMFVALHRLDDMPGMERLKARDVRRAVRAERWISLWLPT
jgi:hypothetical protein